MKEIVGNFKNKLLLEKQILLSVTYLVYCAPSNSILRNFSFSDVNPEIHLPQFFLLVINFFNLLKWLPSKFCEIYYV